MVRRSILTVLVPAMLAACNSAGNINAIVPATADEDPVLPQVSITVAGQTRAVHLETYGDPGDPVLLVLHGTLADFRAMRGFSELSEAYFVVLWDQRGNGLSERIEADEISDEAIVDEIATLKAMFSPNAPVTLIGHSTGAMSAALYMSRRPGDVAQAVLIEPPGLHGDLFESTYDEVFELGVFGEDLNQLQWETEFLGVSGHEEIDYLALAWLQSGQLVNWYCDPKSRPDIPVWRAGAFYDWARGKSMRSGSSDWDFDFASGLGAIDQEILLLGSECSALGAEFQATHHAPLFPDARVEVVNGVGHWMFVENLPATIAPIRDYLTEF
jgi:proline iminopeptidase